MSAITRPRPMTTLAAAGALALVLAACGGTETSDSTAAEQSATTAESTQQETTATEAGEQSADELLASYGLEGMDGREIVDHLDEMPVSERPDDLRASVRTHEVLMTSGDGTEVSVPLPADEFYLSLAPFENQTHECFYHALTSCVGEKFNEPMQVTIVDEDGQTLVDEEITTFDNGFIGVWLPRGINATLTVEHQGLTGTHEISTGDEDLTCLTSLQLT